MNQFCKLSAILVTGAVVAFVPAKSVKAATLSGETPLAGITVLMEEQFTQSQVEDSPVISLSGVNATTENLGIANVENHLNIRKGAGTDKTIIGKLPKDAGCIILSIDKDGWAKIKSGDVTGYVLTDYLYMGNEAVQLAKEVGADMALVTTDVLNVREEANTSSKVLVQVQKGEEIQVLEKGNEWVKVQVDNDEGYVKAEYVEVAFSLKKAVKVDAVSSSSTRNNIINYAMQFLGNRYVWGGNSLTNGTDCSGFVKGVYAHFGYSLSRCSRSQAYDGTKINVSSVQPGDLVFYSTGGTITHVAMYIGNGKIIHASNPRDGIKISNMYYKSPCRAVRILRN